MAAGTAWDNFRAFRILLDEPAATPGLQFDDYARAIGDVILESRAQFAVGIFGDWGSGKTTLMRAIERAITNDPDGQADGRAAKRREVIPVWFNAWRYEREEHLIVPMLDVLREGLATWANGRAAEPDTFSRARRAASAVGRAARALAAGFSVKAGIGVAEVALEPKRIMDQLQDDANADNAHSFYHAGFGAMEAAIDDFVKGTDRRIVVFVDDLDRCLPANALEVLESMKLFFDLPSFVFVVGLDRRVVERAVELKYETLNPAGAPDQAARTGDGVAEDGTDGRRAAGSGGAQGSRSWISGTEYIKKIFQVSFSIPPISRPDLSGFFFELIDRTDLPAEQKDDLRLVVWPHLDQAVGAAAGAINPREIKRFVNGYTIQMKMLTAKLGMAADSNIVLAIQNMSSRPGWLWLYDLLSADPQEFVAVVDAVLQDASYDASWFLGNQALPTAFLAYVNDLARPLLTDLNLDAYITSAESATSTDPRLTRARRVVGGLRHMLRRLGTDQDRTTTEEQALTQLTTELSDLGWVQSTSYNSYFSREIARLTTSMLEQAKSLSGPPSSSVPNAAPPWVGAFLDPLRKVSENLDEMRRATSIGATA